MFCEPKLNNKGRTNPSHLVWFDKPYISFVPAMAYRRFKTGTMRSWSNRNANCFLNVNVMLFSYKKTKNIEIKENPVQSEYYFLQAFVQENIHKLIRIYVNHFWTIGIYFVRNKLVKTVIQKRNLPYTIYMTINYIKWKMTMYPWNK